MVPRTYHAKTEILPPILRHCHAHDVEPVKPVPTFCSITLPENVSMLKFPVKELIRRRKDARKIQDSMPYGGAANCDGGSNKSQAPRFTFF